MGLKKAPMIAIRSIFLFQQIRLGFGPFVSLCVCVYTRIIGGAGRTCSTSTYTAFNTNLDLKYPVQLPGSTEYGTSTLGYRVFHWYLQALASTNLFLWMSNNPASLRTRLLNLVDLTGLQQY